MGLYSRDYYRPSGFNRFSLFPPVIKNLLIINVIVFLITKIGYSVSVEPGLTLTDFIHEYFALVSINSNLGIHFYPWQLITYQFLHADFGHIFWNMFGLWMFGMELEQVFGSRKFLIFYLLSGVGGGLLQLTSEFGITLGASGSLFGVLVAFAMMFPNRPIYIYFLFPVKAKYLIAIYIVMNFLSLGGPNVAYLAHIGGAITGFLFIMLDSGNTVSFDKLGNSIKKIFSSGNSSSYTNKQKFRKPFSSGFSKKEDVKEAEFYDLNDNSKSDDISQDDIDRILDKISASGYQNLTEREKKILFEASKKK